jgi:hypothetical protein
MWKRSSFGTTRSVFSVLLAGSVLLAMGQAARAEEEAILLRTVVMEVSGYTEAEEMDQKVQTADSTLEYLNTATPLLVHMEAIRRAYGIYGQNAEEKQKLLSSLKDRYLAEADNANKFFDYGYAQLVMDMNKNGLFFLRKANDKLQSPYTSLAYGLAQIDVDLRIENAKPDELTTRKMDAVYKLKDALAFEKEDRLPGIWPSYLHIMEGVKTFSAYDSARTEDVTTLFVPYNFNTGDSSGGQFLAMAEGGDEQTPESTTVSTTDVEATCDFGNVTVNWANLSQSKAMDLLHDGKSASINFFTTQPGKPYQVVVMSGESIKIAQFESYTAPYIAEDIEGDGKYELVVRQFDKDPYHPLAVYRWNGTCYAQDKKVASYFK